MYAAKVIAGYDSTAISRVRRYVSKCLKKNAQYNFLDPSYKSLMQSQREKGRDLAQSQSYDKSPYTHRKIQKATWQNKKHQQKL